MTLSSSMLQIINRFFKRYIPFMHCKYLFLLEKNSHSLISLTPTISFNLFLNSNRKYRSIQRTIIKETFLSLLTADDFNSEVGLESGTGFGNDEVTVTLGRSVLICYT